MKVSGSKNNLQSISYAPTPVEKKSAKKNIDVAQLWQHYHALNDGQWISKSFFDKKIKTHGKKAVSRAVETCEKIRHLDGKLGLSAKKLFKIALFIEKTLPKEIASGRYYHHRKATGLNRTVQYDPKTKRVFINLRSSLGSGKHKKVTKAVLYDHKNPVFIACAATSDRCKKELGVHKRFKHREGLARTYAITQHYDQKHHRVMTSIFLKLYNGHSLRHHQHHQGELSQKEKAIVARDLLHGLEHLHKRNLVHCDLHSGNALLHVANPSAKKKKLSAVLIDFGRTKRLSEARKSAPRIHAASRTNAPEAFTRHKIRAKAVDIYALGYQLYHLNYGRPPELPSKNTFVRALHSSKSKQRAFGKSLRANIKKIQTKRKEDINNNSSYNQFQKLILKMCHTNPSTRGSATELRRKLDDIIKNWD